MTYMFQSLDGTAVAPNSTFQKKTQKLAPHDDNVYVPVNNDTVAGKLRECQALGPRLANLENQIRTKQEKAEQADREKQARRMMAAPIEQPKPITKNIGDMKQEELRIRQTLAQQQRKQKELKRLEYLLAVEQKKDTIVKTRDQQKEVMENKKDEKLNKQFEQQKLCKQFHEKQLQKIADLKAIQKYESKQIVIERKQQREYEVMLQKELDDELKNMKQQETQLKLMLLQGFGSGDEQKKRTMKAKTWTEKPVVEGARQQKRSNEVLKGQMVQQRLRGDAK
ncbi:Hypothetical_protein [Hexamita inflata]|uniref:Hypothetical_protein n=1 Tax=Hexamita inflata TaxID=28002 RepID=A0AA86RJE7_9EUKA|nr:Hypothetical protein HINF_LOCUS63583 [Hexamita inflata]CAI9978675.1 Hypothetical protein HINF_LOCUS66320 [Hexamita inflata]